VVRVGRSVPAGATLDTSTITDWQNTAQITTYYKGFIATTATGARRGQPVATWLTPQVLAARQWWTTP